MWSAGHGKNKNETVYALRVVVDTWSVVVVVVVGREVIRWEAGCLTLPKLRKISIVWGVLSLLVVVVVVALASQPRVLTGFVGVVFVALSLLGVGVVKMIR